MKRSTDRILTTHVGSLVRPAKLLEFVRTRESGSGFDEAAYQKYLQESIAEVVSGKRRRGSTWWMTANSESRRAGRYMR